MISTPKSVPVNVSVTRGPVSHLVAISAGQPGGIVVLVLKPGMYRVGSPNVVAGGRLYGAGSTERTVRVRMGRTTTVAIRYAAVSSASSLTVSGLTQSSISFTWSAPKGAKFALRRSSGMVPVSGRTQGTAVPCPW